MTSAQVEAFLAKVTAYSRILLMRHIRPDGDAVGATKGLAQILRLSFPEKEIAVINDDSAASVAFMGPEDAPIAEEAYAEALGIVCDCGNAERVANAHQAKCREIIVIDHHLPDGPYGDLALVEPTYSSTCEVLVELCQRAPDVLKLDRTAATYLYTGMVTDSGRFKFESTTGDTLRRAAFLLDFGPDTDTMYAHLYLEPFEAVSRRARLFDLVKRTENGVAYLYMDLKTRQQFGLTEEEAGDTLSLLDSIRDSLIWLVFLETEDHRIRVRLRARFVPIHDLAAQYHGGGHRFACGATVYSEEERLALLRDADALLKTYKATHEGWL